MKKSDKNIEITFEDEDYQEGDFQIDKYDLTSIPNDFNIKTIFEFIEAGIIELPVFQRNYVWDIKRASKLIESLILGLPVPQIFLYEKGDNKFSVIDGQQRLMSIYYFIKERFPIREKRSELRNIFSQNGNIPDKVLSNDKYFEPFNLKFLGILPKKSQKSNKFEGEKYSTLGDYKVKFNYHRTIRTIIVKQNYPQNDDSSAHEIFSRLNSGGENLKLQEIRMTLYHSKFYEMLFRINILPEWRRILGEPEPNFHMEDIDRLLRSFAMLIDGDNYTPPLNRFLNQFAKKRQFYAEEKNVYLENLFKSFLEKFKKFPNDVFIKQNKFNQAVFESTFAAMCKQPFQKHQLLKTPLLVAKIQQLKDDSEFIATLQGGGTMSKSNAETRLRRAREILEMF